MGMKTMLKTCTKRNKKGIAIAMAAIMLAGNGFTQVPLAYAENENSTDSETVKEYFKDSNGIQYALYENSQCKVYSAENISGAVTIPEQIAYNDVTYSVVGICSEAFYGNESLTGVSIPGSVKCVEESAFYNCSSLTDVNIAEGVEEIQYAAFSGCDKLKQLVIPKSVTKLGEDYYGYIYNICDKNCYIIAQEGSAAEEYAQDNDYKYATEKLPKAGDIVAVAGKSCKVKIVKDFSNGATVLYAGTTSTSASNVTIPDTVTMNNVTYKVVGIADNAFSGNKKITKVTIGKNITSIGKKAFANCSKLKSLVIKPSKITVGAGALSGTAKSLIIKVPSGKVYNFKTYFKGKGNNAATINSTGKALPKKNLKQLGVPFDLKKGKAVNYKVKILLLGTIKETTTVKSVKITKASKKGYKKAVINVQWGTLPLSNSEIHNCVKAAVKNGTYSCGGPKYYTVVDKRTGQYLGTANDFGVTVKSKHKKKKYKDNDGCSINRRYNSTITIIYPEDYKDLCFGVGGESTSVYGAKSTDKFWDGKITFAQSAYYKKDKKNCHFMQIK